LSIIINLNNLFLITGKKQDKRVEKGGIKKYEDLDSLLEN